MKAARQALIREIIESSPIGKQEELAEALRSRGMIVTQATVSRDIKEMHLSKVLCDDGSCRYAVMDRESPAVGDRLIQMLTGSVVDMACVNNQIIIHTLSAGAHVAGEALDSLKWPEILGTIAGDNTILVIIRTNEEALPVMNRLKDLIG